MRSDSDAIVPDPMWSDPNTCPFCEMPLSDPGAGFIDHLAESRACDRGFDAWRGHVAGDMYGEWTG